MQSRAGGVPAKFETGTSQIKVRGITDCGYLPQQLIRNNNRQCPAYSPYIDWPAAAICIIHLTKKVIGTVVPLQSHEGIKREYRYGSTYSKLCHQMEMSSQLQAPEALPQGRSPVRTEQKVVWAPKPVWRFREEKNIFPLPGFERRIVQPIVQSLHRLRYSRLYPPNITQQSVGMRPA